jgi:alkylation response protein AidB-like acyl-CoA dehydrogenase
MNFELTEEQLAVREAARDFAQNVLKPGVIERDRDQRFPAKEIKQLGELGFMGMMKKFPKWMRQLQSVCPLIIHWFAGD